MKKLYGLRFLQENFPRLTVDCIFVDKVENLDEKALIKKEEAEQIWRVRGGHKIGSELNMPQGSFKDIISLKRYMKEQQRKDANMEFVIHSVSPKYFTAPFVGTLAVYNNHQNPGMRIELQKVTRELVENIDKKGGKRPRDWEACLILDYEFRNKFPKIRRNNDVNLEEVKNAIAVIHEVGEEIFDIYDKQGNDIDTFTRFNIYDLGQVLFDDHRSVESFVPKCKCPVVPSDFGNERKIEKKILER